MKPDKKVLAILAVMCVIFSACAVCAAENNDTTVQQESPLDEHADNDNTTNTSLDEPVFVTGNPILALFITSAFIGGYAVIRKK